VLRAKIYRHKIFVFGVSEALVMSLAKPNLIVITGLGRLLMREQKRRKFFFLILKNFYKTKKVVLLNKSDFRIFTAIGFSNCLLINGEGVDLKRIQEVAILERQPTNESNTNFLYAGRLLKSKNVGIIISYFDMFLQNKNESNSCNLTLVGDNDFGSSDAIDQATLNSLIVKYPSNVRVLGYQEDVRPYMRSSDVYISLSKREGLPFSVVEALALGCKCILSDVPGHKEFKNIDNVTLVRNSKDFDLAVRSMIKKSKAKVVPNLKKFSQNIICNDIIKIIDQLEDN